MKSRKNKGFSKPTILALSAAIIAGLGYGTYSYLQKSSTISGTNLDNIDDSTKQLLLDIDLNSKESIAAVLYSSVLTENFTGVPILVNRLRVLEFLSANKDKSEADMLPEDKTKTVDITQYLSGAAIDKLVEKTQYIDQRLTSKQYPETYKFYLSSLISIFSFFHSTDPELEELSKGITAYQAFENNPDYTINDIRALFGPINSLKVCRYLMGGNDYSRISPAEMKDYITSEIGRLIRQIPVNIVKQQRVYSSSDFASITVSSLKEILALNHSIPSLITNISLIEGIKKEESEKSYQQIKDNYVQTVNKGLNFLTVAEVFYQCQATTSEPFKINVVKDGRPILGVAKIGKLSLNAVKVKITNGLAGCAGINEAFILVPDLNGYNAILNRGIKKMSDSELATYNNDVKLIDAFYNGKANIGFISVMGSDVAAVENHLEQNPEQGYFIGVKDKGLLFNLKLDSFNYLRSLDLSPNTETIFAPSIKLTKKSNQARYKLGLIEDFRKVEQRMADLDFAQLETTPYQYTVSRIAEDNVMTFNYQNMNGNSDSVKDTSIADLNDENSLDTENTIEIAYSVVTDDSDSEIENNTDNSSENNVIVAQSENKEEEEKQENIVATNTTEAEPTKDAVVDTKENTVEQQPEAKEVIAVTEVEKPLQEQKIEVTEIAANPNTTEESAVVVKDEPIQKDPLTPAQLRKAKVADVQSEITVGNSDAMYEMAVRYINGKNGVKRNIKKGTDLLEQATKAGNIKAEYMLGSIYYNSPKSSKAKKAEGVNYILNAAKDGLTDAAATAGNLYYEGKAVSKDYAKAIEYLTIAAETDDNKAQYLLGKMYLDGIGTSKASHKAISLLSASAKTNPNAALELAKIYEGGVLEDVEKDESTSNDYYVFAARHNIKEANRKAGLFLIQKKSTAKEGAKYLSTITDKADTEVNNALLNYYIAQNDTKEITKRIVNADASIQDKYPVEMGILYETGNGVKQDYKKAQEFYRKGISLNIPSSYCRLGNLFYDGRGVKPDLRAAVGQYTRGSDAGATECSKSLAYIKISHRNYENFYEAFTLLSKSLSANKNDSSVQALMGAMYLYGQGTEKDEKTANTLLNKAQSQESNFLAILHNGDTAQMKKLACTNPVLAGALGVKENNSSYLAVATLNDLFFIGDLQKSGISTNYEDIYKAASSQCAGVTTGLLYDAKPKFKKPSNENTPLAKEQYELGMYYFCNKEYAQAFNFVKKAADQGYAKAHNNLGVFYILGIGTAKNGKNAFEQFMRAAATGDAKATFNAAAMRKNGIDIKPDHAKAIDQLLSAAGKGNSIAGMHLIFGYDYGNGMKKSDYDAFKAFASVVISKDK